MGFRPHIKYKEIKNMSSISSKVRQSVVLTADGQLQGLVNTSSTSTATNLLKVNIMNIFAQSSAADAEIKIYNETGSSKTASKLIIEPKATKIQKKTLNIISTPIDSPSK